MVFTPALLRCNHLPVPNLIVGWVLENWVGCAELCITRSVLRHGVKYPVYALAFKEKTRIAFILQLKVPSATEAVQKSCQTITCLLIVEFCRRRHRKGTTRAPENCRLLALEQQEKQRKLLLCCEIVSWHSLACMISTCLLSHPRPSVDRNYLAR